MVVRTYKTNNVSDDLNPFLMYPDTYSHRSLVNSQVKPPTDDVYCFFVHFLRVVEISNPFVFNFGVSKSSCVDDPTT